MTAKFGYLLPTREYIMRNIRETKPLITLAKRADTLGYDSIWVGDSLFARPRHEPLTFLSSLTGHVQQASIGTAVLLPALRNPVLLAHQVATLDRLSEGRLILGVGIAADVANVREEFIVAGVPFEKRGARMVESIKLCQALWSGKTISWDGFWKIKDLNLGLTPHTSGGPSVWIGGSGPLTLQRAGSEFDGWFPTGPNSESFSKGWEEVTRTATLEGRDPEALTGAVYLTISVDDDESKANGRIDAYLEEYYKQPAALMRKTQACFGGSIENARGWINDYINRGATHIVLRFAGDPNQHLECFSPMAFTDEHKKI